MAKSKRLREKAKSKTVYASAKKRTEEHETGFQPTSFKIPEGFKRFKFKKGNNRINVMPFIAGKGNPFADEGIAHYERTFFVHKSVGPEEQSYCCLRKTFNKPCPICDHTAKLRRAPNADNDSIRAMEPKERQLFCFEDAKEPDAGYQIFECSHYKGFGELLDNKIKSSEDDDNYENFFHLEGGMTLKVFATEEKFNGRAYMSPNSIEMIERKEDFDEDVIDKIPCLDDCLIELSYKELKKIFTAGSSDDDESGDDDDDAPKKSKTKDKPKSKKVEDDEDEDEEETDDDDDAGDEDEDEDSDAVNVGDVVTWKYKGKKMLGEVIKINEKKKIATVTVEGKEMPSIVDLADLTIVEDNGESEDEDEDDEPKPKKGKKPTKKKKDADDEEDDDGDDGADDDDEGGGEEAEETEDDEEDEDSESDSDADDEGDDEEEEEVKPKKKGKKKVEEEEDTDDDEPWDDEDSDDGDDDEEEEEEEPAPKPKKKKK